MNRLSDMSKPEDTKPVSSIIVDECKVTKSCGEKSRASLQHDIAGSNLKLVEKQKKVSHPGFESPLGDNFSGQSSQNRACHIPKIFSHRRTKKSSLPASTRAVPLLNLDDYDSTDVTRDLETVVRKISRGSPSRFDFPSPNRSCRYGQGIFFPETISAFTRLGLFGLAKGYEQYRESLKTLRPATEFGEASSDDLSSEWESSSESELSPDGASSDIQVVSATEPQNFDSKVNVTTESCLPRGSLKRPSGWRKLRSMVQWTPFIQTYKNRRYQWVQLAGHSGNFKAGKDPGTVLKKLCPQEEHCYKLFSKDTISPFVPKYQGTLVLDDDEKFLQLQDCLSSFTLPSIMDCKIGVRTYLEEELAKAKEKPKLRKDMYEKMVAVDPSAPTEEEHRLKGITKPRYMVWRETISSTAMLGFRIEGVKKSDGTSTKDFKTTKTKEQVLDSFRNFIAGSAETARQYLDRLKMIRQALERSEFFKSHELIGSSLLFVHDSAKACVWLIDFGKTVRLPEGTIIDHKSPWEVGNHEDGYLIGIQNLITIFSELVLILERESDEKDGTFNRKIAQPSPSHS